MRSLAPKLLLAFLAVSLTVALLAAAITRYTTQKDFENLVLSNAQNNFIDRATTYYEITGSWQGFAASIIRRQNQQDGLPGQPQGQQPPGGNIQNPPAGQPPGQPPQQEPPPQQPLQQPQQGDLQTQPLTFALIDTNGRVSCPLESSAEEISLQMIPFRKELPSKSTVKRWVQSSPPEISHPWRSAKSCS